MVFRRKRLMVALLALAGLGAAAGASATNYALDEDAKKFTVSRVVDGDTLKTTTGETIRLIGVDTPETVDPNRPDGCFGSEASNFTKQQLTNKTIRVETDKDPKDRYGRILGYVYLEDGTFFNRTLITEGYAKPLSVGRNTAHAMEFANEATFAQSANKGLWGKCK
jgi:micrococcal nuclease